MSELLTNHDFVELMKESFSRGQLVTFTPSGRSMLPMLNGRDDKVTFSPKPERLRRYDVAFYLRPKSGQLVLHRMVGFDKDGGYVFSGDGQYYYEYGVTDDDVLALMTAFTHRGKERRVTDPRYRAYIRLMMLKKYLRIFLGRVYHRIFR